MTDSFSLHKPSRVFCDCDNCRHERYILDEEAEDIADDEGNAGEGETK